LLSREQARNTIGGNNAPVDDGVGDELAGNGCNCNSPSDCGTEQWCYSSCSGDPKKVKLGKCGKAGQAGPE
jgi:hypothetical protein